MKPWRDCARQVIRKAIGEGRALSLDGPALRKFVSARYPFGERAMHPYKVWLDEVARQLGTRKRGNAKLEAQRAAWDAATGQSRMFEGEPKP